MSEQEWMRDFGSQFPDTGDGIPPEAMAGLTEAMIQFLDIMKQFEEAARAYREHMVSHGWSETVAEGVSASWLHAQLIKVVKGG